MKSIMECSHQSRPNHDQSPVIVAFDGAVTVYQQQTPTPRPNAFAFEVTFFLQSPQLTALSTRKPPLHFHPYQEEYMRVLEGKLGVEIDGQERVIGPDDGEVMVEPWQHHRLYPATMADATNKCRFLLSGQQSEEAYELDTLFFENWYGYQNEVVLQKRKMDWIQVMCVS